MGESINLKRKRLMLLQLQQKARAAVPPTEAPAQSTDRGETLSQRTERAFNFDPNIAQRAALLPFGKNRQGETEFAVPQALKDVAQSSLLAGHAMEGGEYTPADVAQAGLDFIPARTPQAHVPGKRETRQQVMRDAPTQKDIKAEAGNIYKGLQGEELRVPGGHFEQLVLNTGQKFKAEGFSPSVSPKANGLLTEWTKTVESMGEDIRFIDLENLRKQASRLSRTMEGEESHFGGVMVDQIDRLINNLPLKALPKKARALWRKSIKLDEIGAMVLKAEQAAGGFDAGLQAGARRILGNKKLRRGYSEDEIAALQRVKDGGGLAPFLRSLRHLNPASGRYLGPVIGGVLGSSIGGVPGVVGAAAIGVGAERAAQAAAVDATEYLKALIAYGAQKPVRGPLKTGASIRAYGKSIIGPAVGTQLTPEQERAYRAGNLA